MTEQQPYPDLDRRRSVVIAGHTGDVDHALAALRDVDPMMRELALGALHRLGVLSAEQLSSLMTDTDRNVRRRVAELAAHHPEVDLTPLLNDADPIIVEVAIWACGEHVDVTDAVLERIIALTTTDEDPLVREAGAAALGAIGDERGLEAILAACNDKPAVRRRAVLALAPFEGDQVEAAIDAALTDRDWQVRQAAEDLRR
jgi:HEAT repeat protein